MTALVSFGIYLVFVFVLAAVANREGKGKSFLSEYFLGSRGIGVWAFAFTYAATSASGGSFMGFPSLIYTHGWVLAWWIAGYMVVPLVALGLLAKRINQVGRIAGAITVPELLRRRFASNAVGNVATVLRIFLLLTILSLAPALLIMLTSFTRIVMVLSILRQAMGTQTMPPNQVVIGLSLFLTFFVMTPVWQTVNQEALQPYLEERIDTETAIEQATAPLRTFMLRQTKEKDLALFVDIANMQKPRNVQDIPMTVLVPSFVISEVKTAFQIGLLLYVPFLVVDMVVASVLLSMGMMMLPPVMVSLPFKLMLFVLADGWYLLVGSLVRSFG